VKVGDIAHVEQLSKIYILPVWNRVNAGEEPKWTINVVRPVGVLSRFCRFLILGDERSLISLYVETCSNWKFREENQGYFQLSNTFPAHEWCVMDTVYQKQEPHTRSVGSFEVVCSVNLKIHGTMKYGKSVHIQLRICCNRWVYSSAVSLSTNYWCVLSTICRYKWKFEQFYWCHYLIYHCVT